MNEFINQKVICPECKTEIPFDMYDDVFDTSADTLSGRYIEHTAYTCPECDCEFTAQIHYTMKFEKVAY